MRFQLNPTQIVIKNISALFIARFFNLFVTFTISIILTRALGSEKYGILSLAMNLPFIFAGAFYIYDFFISRDIARNKDQAEKYLSNVTLIKLILCMFTFCIILILIKALKYDIATQRYILLGSSYFFIEMLFMEFQALCIALEKMERYASILIIEKILVLFLLTIGLKLGLNLVFIMVIYVLSGIAKLSLTFFFGLKGIIRKLSINFDLGLCKYFFRQGVYLLLGAIFLESFMRAPYILLSRLSSSSVLGWFSLPYNLIQNVYILPEVLLSAIFARAVKKLDDPLIVKNIYESQVRYIAVLLLPFIIIVNFKAKYLITFFYGSNFLPSAYSLIVLSWFSLFFIVFHLQYNFVFLIGKERFRMIPFFIVFPIQICLSIILITRYGQIGASIAVLLCSILLVTIFSILIKTTKYSFNIFSTLGKMLVIGLLLMVILFFVKKVGLILFCIMAMLIYSIFLYIFKIVSKEDLRLIKQVCFTNQSHI